MIRKIRIYIVCKLVKERTFEGVVFPFRHCKFTTYIRRKKVIKCVFPRLSNVSNSFAVFCLTCLFQCLIKR